MRHSSFGGDLIAESSSFALPGGYRLRNIGVNEQKLRTEAGGAVYAQLVSPEDDEFHILMFKISSFLSIQAAIDLNSDCRLR